MHFCLDIEFDEATKIITRLLNRLQLKNSQYVGRRMLQRLELAGRQAGGLEEDQRQDLWMYVAKGDMKIVGWEEMMWDVWGQGKMEADDGAVGWTASRRMVFFLADFW